MNSPPAVGTRRVSGQSEQHFLQHTPTGDMIMKYPPSNRKGQFVQCFDFFFFCTTLTALWDLRSKSAAFYMRCESLNQHFQAEEVTEAKDE